MFQTLFLNTFGCLSSVKWGILCKYNDTALLRRHRSSQSNSILSLVSQNTLTITSIRHFPRRNGAVTDTFMLGTNHRNTPQLFSRPHTSINSRYTIICKSKDSVTIRVKIKKRVFLDVFETSLTIYLDDFYICYFIRTLFLFIQQNKELELH